MNIVIEYIIHWETVIQDKKVFSDNNLTFSDFDEKFSFANFLDSFANAKVVISDLNDNTIYFNCSLLSFTYNFLDGLDKLSNKINKFSYCFGSNESDFLLKYYIESNKLIIEKNEKKYSYDLFLFLKKINEFRDRVIYELPLYYEDLDESKYFIKFKVNSQIPQK